MIDPPTHAENHDFNSRLRFMGCATLLILVVGWVGWFSPFDDLLDRSGTPLGADYAMFYVAEALLSQSAFKCLLDLPGAKPIGFSPAVVVALSDDERTQGRICVESKTSVFEPGRKGQSEDDAISLSLTIRQYPWTAEKFDALRSFESQCRLVQELMAEKIIPNFAKPLTETIAQKRLT